MSDRVHKENYSIDTIAEPGTGHVKLTSICSQPRSGVLLSTHRYAFLFFKSLNPEAVAVLGVWHRSQHVACYNHKK